MSYSLYSNNIGLRSRFDDGDSDVDPMSTVANIADAMLVFACGLMVALVVAWEVDLANVQQVELENSEEIEDVQTLQDILSADGSSYVQRGTVYQDPRTGTMYLLEEDGSGNGSADATGSDSNSSDSASANSASAASTASAANGPDSGNSGS